MLHMCLSLCEKLSLEGPTGKIFISKKEWTSLPERTKNRKFILAGFTKKNVKNSLTN